MPETFFSSPDKGWFCLTKKISKKTNIFFKLFNQLAFLALEKRETLSAQCAKTTEGENKGLNMEREVRRSVFHRISSKRSQLSIIEENLLSSCTGSSHSYSVNELPTRTVVRLDSKPKDRAEYLTISSCVSVRMSRY